MKDVRSRKVYHSLHELDETPECQSIILHDSVDWSQEVTHALHVAEIAVVFVVGQQHVFHLLEMDVRADLREGRVRIGVWDILALEQGNMTISAVNILF